MRTSRSPRFLLRARALAPATLATACFLATAPAGPAAAATATPPSAVTGKASEVTETTATLNATVNPNGTAVSKCTFEYGTKVPYEKTASCATLPASGTSPVAVSAAVSGLSAKTTYHFRIVAENAATATKGEGADETFKTLGPPSAITGKASSVTETGATLNATVNPNGTAVSGCAFEYGTKVPYEKMASCASSPGSGTSPVAVSAAVSGLSANTTYHFRIVAENASTTTKGEGADGTFKTLTPPSAVTGKASEVTETTATLNATVNPNGTAVSKCTFEYGTAAFFEISHTYELPASCATPPGSGSSPVAVSAAITGLSANTTYHFRVVAENAATATKGEGADETFKTLGPPSAITGKASSITETGATLNATVNPNGTAVSGCAFEYGTKVPYEKMASCASSPGSGTSPVAVSAPVSGLSANTIYHFRIVAENASTTTKGEGADATLETSATPQPSVVPSVPAPLSSGEPSSRTTPLPAGGTSSAVFSRPAPPTLRLLSKSCKRSDCTVRVQASPGTGLAAVVRVEALLTFLQPYPCHEGRLQFTCTRLVVRRVNARATAAGRYSIVASDLKPHPYTLMLTAIDAAHLYQLAPVRVALTTKLPHSKR
ncbi:MAG TPA: hypothetical protein VEJ23_01920 [Solirubrobacteraceae bacterium]|nr:hypothetical protein [Solirubrobacteraceae bacterium]